MKPTYLLIGSGRVSTHFLHYFQLLGLTVLSWSRRESNSTLSAKAKPATHILCLISDPAIEGFLAEHREILAGKTLVHASGALSTPLADGAHPLMTFTRDALYDLKTYQAIPFILEKGRRSFAEVLPGLPNAHFTIAPNDKSLYHALCVLSGNFTTILWQKAFHDFGHRLGLPHEVLLPYMERVCANLAAQPSAALTGPLARGDNAMIEKHLAVLAGDPFADVYRAFVGAVASMNKNTPSSTGGRS